MKKIISLKVSIDGEDSTGVISDGYHTFDELYEHRIRLFIELCKKIEYLSHNEQVYGEVWTSVLHSDGSSFGDWFILGVGTEKGRQITYHLPARFWNEVCEFARVVDKAPEFDGHTSADVLERIKAL